MTPAPVKHTPWPAAAAVALGLACLGWVAIAAIGWIVLRGPAVLVAAVAP